MRADRRSGPAALLLLALLLLPPTGVAQEGDQDTAPPEAASALRFVHASPDAPRVDLLLDGEAIVRDLAFGGVGPYLVLPAGEHEVQVFPHRPPTNPEETVRRLEPVSVLLTLNPGTYHTLALSGFYEPPPAEGRTGWLSVNVDPDEVEFTLRGPRSYSAEFTGDQLIEDLVPGEYRVDARLEGYRAATYRADVAALETATLSITLQRGEEPEGGAEAPAPVPAQGEPGTWRKVELHLYPDAFDAPPPGLARVRIVHASPITPEVTVEVVGTESDVAPTALIAGLSFPNAGPYVAVRAGARGLRVRLSGSSTVLTEVPSLPFEAGASYTLLLVGDPGDDFVRVLPILDGMIAPVASPGE